jgi:uncharacterized protein (TIGR02145 family)
MLAMKFKLSTFLLILSLSTLFLHAQDYLISFAGSGVSTTVTTVKVENLTQRTNLTISGSDVLNLKGTITGIETVSDNETGKITFYPNPMNDYARMKFVLPEPGETMITLHDISGRKIAQKQDLLFKGQHTYGIQGVEEGIYFVKISSGRYSYTGRLLCSESQSKAVKIEYENALALQEKQSDSKGKDTEIIMQYTTGDRLKLTGTSDIYSTVITDVPIESKTITFNFIACTDGDGNNYPIVQIGTTKGTTNNLDPSEEESVQNWMAENLKTTKYNDGTAIPNITDNNAWAASTTGAYSDYSNTPANSTTYGRLYNWYAVDNNAVTKVASNGGKNVCPTSWHVPNDAEWTTLTTYLGGESVAGGKLKESGTIHWAAPNTGATDETGFTALPGGYRSTSGPYSGIGYRAYWWSSTESATTFAWLRGMYYLNAIVYRNIDLKLWGFSVRCLKD